MEWLKHLISSSHHQCVGRNYWQSPTWTSSASTMPEQRNVSGLPAKHAASIVWRICLWQYEQTMWLQDDGVPAHFCINVHRNLNIFPRHWIGCGGPVAWPARPPDLNPLDFYLWGHLKSIVYGEPVPDVQTLQQRVYVACDTIRTQPGTSEWVRQSMMWHVHAYIVSYGCHFQHLLWHGWDSGHVLCARALCLMMFYSTIYRGNYAYPNTRWYECLWSISSQESPPEACQ